MKLPDRKFETVHAEPGARPLWVGLMGPSGGGKTFSALKLAKGIQSVVGGRINFIDTESGRGLHYADMFDYDYTPFPPPHGSLDYLAAITHAVKSKVAHIVIVDSFSHEHDGEGGLIDFQEAEMKRLGGDDWQKQERVKMLAWTKPKAARKALLRGMLAFGTEAVFILCFRADEQSKPVKKGDKTEVVQMGFMPIAGKPFVYEATVCALLMPGANGVPTWEPENVGEKMMRKLPEQFKRLFEESKGKPLSEEHGRALAEWAKGGSTSKPSKQFDPPRTEKSLAERVDLAVSSINASDTEANVEKAFKRTEGLRSELSRAGDIAAVYRLKDARKDRLKALGVELEGEDE